MSDQADRLVRKGESEGLTAGEDSAQGAPGPLSRWGRCWKAKHIKPTPVMMLNLLVDLRNLYFNVNQMSRYLLAVCTDDDDTGTIPGITSQVPQPTCFPKSGGDPV